ncbi:hypothetical protein J6590_101846 [Homalodisca vitripennis]|nr:hypothetical protein J6590_101846 [Homalodisca vitripennis]
MAPVAEAWEGHCCGRKGVGLVLRVGRVLSPTDCREAQRRRRIVRRMDSTGPRTVPDRSRGLLECPLATFLSGSTHQKIPFVFLPLKGQIVYPSAEISFSAASRPANERSLRRKGEIWEPRYLPVTIILLTTHDLGREHNTATVTLLSPGTFAFTPRPPLASCID